MNPAPDEYKYVLQHARATVDLTLTRDRLIVATMGTALLDRLRTIDMALSDLKQFCIVPTIGVQNMVGRRSRTVPGEFAYDHSYDAEFIFSYLDQGKVRRKRVFVDSQDEAFEILLAELKLRRPDASLLHLDPVDARKQIGVMSPRTAVYIIVAVLVGGPILVAMIMLTIMILRGFKD